MLLGDVADQGDNLRLFLEWVTIGQGMAFRQARLSGVYVPRPRRRHAGVEQQDDS